MLKHGQKLPLIGCNMQGFLWTPWNATSRTTAQDALWHHIVNRNTSSQPFMTPCTLQVMNRIPGDLTPSWAGCWGPPHSCSVSRAIYLPAQRNLLWHHKDICNRAHLHDKYYLWHYLIIWFNLFILQALLNGFLNFEEFDVEEYDHYEVCTLYTDLCL